MVLSRAAEEPLREGETVQRIQTGRSKAVLVAGALVLIAVGAGLLLYSLLGSPSVEAPENKVLKLTVPEMKRVDDLPVYDAPAHSEEALRRGSLHVRGTGFPWQEEANVYIAGHRLGYPGTRSHLVFWDLPKLENGDEVILTDANGTEYTYEVFKEFVVGPNAKHVMQPIEGKNVVSLQSCTLPDYARRIIARAELKDVNQNAS
jgi:sortase A